MAKDGDNETSGRGGGAVDAVLVGHYLTEIVYGGSLNILIVIQ
ncbi:hypothetical protein ACFQ3Z_24635 [Streptomyces nogalater]